MTKTKTPAVAVVGSVNLDIVAAAPRLPVPGETVTDAELNRYPGGKGANQALAARRLGAHVSLVARVGDDAVAEEALALLRAEGVDLSQCLTVDCAATGVALIAVDPSGENQIVVAPGANRLFEANSLLVPASDALICQLEVPVATIAEVAASYTGFFCINVAPAKAVPMEILQRADLLVMNETEAAFVGAAIDECEGIIALTHGARGAELRQGGSKIAEARPPQVTSIDATGAGDTFTAALTVALVEGQQAQQALLFACAAGASATTKRGAQPSFPNREDVELLLSR
ncbi:MAG: ribokinase [Pseudomonadales bacterium]